MVPALLGLLNLMGGAAGAAGAAGAGSAGVALTGLLGDSSPALSGQPAKEQHKKAPSTAWEDFQAALTAPSNGLAATGNLNLGLTNAKPPGPNSKLSRAGGRSAPRGLIQLPSMGNSQMDTYMRGLLNGW